MKGLTIGEAFRRETVFPRVVVNLVAVSEKAGHIESILDTLADFYESEIDTSIKTLISFLEPALLLVIGSLKNSQSSRQVMQELFVVRMSEAKKITSLVK